MKGDARSHGLWEASAPAAPVTGALHGKVVVDVAIVGAGFTGLSAALHLHQKGLTTAVIESDEIGYGGSGRNVGLVNAGMWVMPSALPGELGALHGERLLQLLGSGPELVHSLVNNFGMDCEAVRNGTLHCAVGKAGFANIEQRAREWQKVGAPVQLLDAAETAKRTGTTAYAGSLLDLRAGTIQPLAYARGLAHAAMDGGAKIFTQSKVVKSHDAGTHWELTTESGGVVHAQWIIVATNAFTDAVGQWAPIRTELVRLPYFNMATTPLPPKVLEQILPNKEGAWDTPDVLTSFRLDQSGRLVFGSVGALQGVGRRIHQDWGRRAMARLFPALKNVGFEYEWYGWIGMTDNSLPRFHRLGRNTVSFSGYNGRGIATGTVFGRELARLVAGDIKDDELPLPVTQPQKTPYRQAREAYYKTGSEVAHATGARFKHRKP